MGVDERREEKGGRTFHGEEGSLWVDAPWMEKKKRKYSSFAIHAVYNRSNLDGIERKLDPRVFIIYTWSNVCRDHSVLEFRFEGKDYLFRILVPSPLPLVPKTTKAN